MSRNQYFDKVLVANRGWENEPKMTLNAVFVYLPEFVDIISGVTNIRQY
jgi:hypothetical protein